MFDVSYNNPLFNEKIWISTNDGFLPSDWVSRHPFFYKMLNISHYGIKRKYKNY